MAAARDAGPVGAFATYTMGEVRLREYPAAAVGILELAVSPAEDGGTAQIAEVARIALISALARLGRRHEALQVFADLLLVSASADPSAPPVTGDDISRYRELQHRITSQIGGSAHGQMTALTALATAHG